MLVALRDGPARITDLAAPLPISFAAAARHVGVLEAAGLIEREVRGRDHWLTVRSAGLQPAEEWIAEQVSFWSPRADALAARLERRNRAAGDRAPGWRWYGGCCPLPRTSCSTSGSTRRA